MICGPRDGPSVGMRKRKMDNTPCVTERIEQRKVEYSSRELAGGAISMTLCFAEFRSLFYSSFVLFSFLLSPFCLLFSPDVAGCSVFVSLLGDIHQWNGQRPCNGGANAKGGQAVFPSKNSQKPPVWNQFGITLLVLKHTNTHILIFNPGEGDLCYFSSPVSLCVVMLYQVWDMVLHYISDFTCC